jgi:RNA polymerase sigma factor (sigma-70 family)
MKFKNWLVINESLQTDTDLVGSLIAYQSNQEDKEAKNNFYSSVIKFVRMWCAKRNCDYAGMTKENLASDVYTKLANKINNLENGKEFLNSLIPNQFPKYLSAMVRNLKIDAMKKNMRAARRSGASLDMPRGETEEAGTIADYIPSKEPAPEEVGIRNEKISIVRKAIQDLKNPIDREIGDLFYNQDMKYTDIAEKLNIPLGTVKSRISGFHRKIKDALLRLGISG